MTSRGPDPEDRRDFGKGAVVVLRCGVAEVSWLLSRGYPLRSAVTFVGDHHQITGRQRNAVSRAAASDDAVQQRAAKEVGSVAGRHVQIDGFNTLITLERALAGGPVFVGRDSAIRDVAGVHGSYRASPQLRAAISALVPVLSGATSVHWLFDRPVSNSGRLAERVRQVDGWTADCVARPDAELRAFDGVIVTSDGPVLSACSAWFGAVQRVLQDHSDARVVDLRSYNRA